MPLTLDNPSPTPSVRRLDYCSPGTSLTCNDGGLRINRTLTNHSSQLTARGLSRDVIEVGETDDDGQFGKLLQGQGYTDAFSHYDG